jgi:Transposase
VLVSAKLVNDETEIRALLARMIGLADQLTWAVDIIGAPSALLLTMLRHADQSVRYASGRLVSAMSAAYTGEGKTDAKDAYVIVETAPQSWTGERAARHRLGQLGREPGPVGQQADRDTARVSHHADTIGGHGQPRPTTKHASPTECLPAGASWTVARTRIPSRTGTSVLLHADHAADP